jgi:acetyl esterase/lipase
MRRLAQLSALCVMVAAGGAAVAEPPAAPSAMPAARAGFEQMIDRSIKHMNEVNRQPEISGTGPYPAKIEVDLALPNATIYRPANLGRLGRTKLGLVIWGNGGCSNDGASALSHLAEIASHGYLVITPGKPLTGPLALPGAQKGEPMRTTIQDLRGALDWALAENGRAGSPYHHRIDTAAVAAAGHSCGAMQAILLSDDPRIKTLIVHNSGVMPAIPDNPPLLMHDERLAGVHQPALFFLGGESDIVWKYEIASFDRLKAPAMLVSRELGHGGMFNEPHGGQVAKLAVAWLQWRLRGDRSNAKFFAGTDCTLCRDAAWTVRKNGMR